MTLAQQILTTIALLNGGQLHYLNPITFAAVNVSVERDAIEFATTTRDTLTIDVISL